MRRLVLGGWAYLLIIAGLISLEGDILLLAIPLLLPFIIGLITAPAKPKLRLARRLSADRVIEGMPVDVELTLTNSGNRVEHMQLEDRLPEMLIPDDQSHRMMASLDRNESLTWSYRIYPPRGHFELNRVQVQASDPLGLFTAETELSAASTVLSLPRAERIRRIAIRPRATHGYAGPVPAHIGGSGVDFYGVRQYQVGDPLRWINWRVSARHPQLLFTNEYEQERIADVGIILDARLRTDIDRGPEALFDHSVRAAASVANAFLQDGNRVGLLIYGGFLKWVFPGYGKVQHERIMRALAQAVTGESEVFDNLDYLPTRFFPPRSQIVLISPLCKEDVPILVRLRARGYQVMVISPNPIYYEARFLEPSAEVELAIRMARMEHSLIFSKLRQAGIQSVNWRTDRPLNQVLRTSLGRMPTWSRAAGLEA